MRSINASTDVYAAIWARREAGEESEDDILRRILNVPSASPSNGGGKPPLSARIGFRDPRFGIELPEGFEIFRVYKGAEYRAKAVGGGWLLQNSGASYPSLNQLSKAVSGNVENAWQNWYYTGPDGKRRLVSALRK